MRVVKIKQMVPGRAAGPMGDRCVSAAGCISLPPFPKERVVTPRQVVEEFVTRLTQATLPRSWNYITKMRSTIK